MTWELSFLRGSRNVSFALPFNLIINLHPLIIIAIVITIIVAIIDELGRHRFFRLLDCGWRRFFDNFIVIGDGIYRHFFLLGLLRRLGRALLLEVWVGLLLSSELRC